LQEKPIETTAMFPIKMLTQEKEWHCRKNRCDQWPERPPCSHAEGNLPPDFSNEPNFSAIGEVSFFFRRELYDHIFQLLTSAYWSTLGGWLCQDDASLRCIGMKNLHA
jgi:hypothetical protein